MMLFKKFLDTIVTSWSNALASKLFQKQMLVTLFFFIACFVVSVYFIDRCELRNGHVLHDVILDMLPHKDVSTYIFILTYGGIVLAIASSLSAPHLLIKGFQMYAILLLMRAVFIALFPLNPPQEMVLLQDKIGSFLLNGQQYPITKDLFFSGHTSTLFLMFLITQQKKVKATLLTISIIVPILLLVQHVHYTIDILAAPVFSYAIFSFVNVAHQKAGSILSKPI